MESRSMYNVALLVLRLVLGVIMTAHGLQKMGWIEGGAGSLSGTVEWFVQQGIPNYLGYLAVAAELLGGIGLIVGLLGRLAAFGIAIVMAVAIFQMHLDKGLFGASGGFEFPLSLLGIAIALMLLGMGSYSLDSKIAKKMDKTIGGQNSSG